MEEKVRFLFVLSSEGTKQWQEGKLILSSGGLRRSDGSIYEMATPVCFDPNSVPQDTYKTTEEAFQRQLALASSRVDQSLQNINALKEIAWMDYALNCRTYEMTYEGFQQIIGRLDDISAQLSRVERRLDNKEFNDRLELESKYKNYLKSIAGFMETKDFNATNVYFDVTKTLDKMGAHFDRLHNELMTGTGNDQMVLASFLLLLRPYAYVVSRYSALYYYENDVYPSSYENWVEAILKITRDTRVKNKFQYYLRVNSDCSLEDIYIACDGIMFNLREIVEQIGFDHSYVLLHSKEEYLSIDRQKQDKIDQNAYQIIDGHLCIEL